MLADYRYLRATITAIAGLEDEDPLILAIDTLEQTKSGDEWAKALVQGEGT